MNPENDFFTALILSQIGVKFTKEHRFHNTRKWRFDYAYPDKMIAIEVEGGAYKYGRHNRPTGFIEDMEKYNTATSMGWRILRVTPQQLISNKTIDFIKKLITINE